MVAVPYGAAALAALSHLVDTLKGADPLEPVMVLVPDALTGTAIRRHLAERRPTGVAALDVLTLADLADRLAGPVLGAAGRRPVPRTVVLGAVAAHLRRAPGRFAAVAQHPATAAALARAVEALDHLGEAERAAVEALLEPGALGGAGRSAGVLPDVLTTADAVRAELGPSWATSSDTLRAAASVLDRVAIGDGSAALLGARHVVLYLPRPLNSPQSRLVASLDSVADVHVVLGLTGSPRAEGPVLVGVRSALADLPPRIEEPDPALARRVRHASDPEAEVAATVRDVAQELRSTPGHRIAVLYSTARPYARILHEQLAAAGIAVSGPGSRPVAELAAGRLLLGALRLVDQDLPRRAVFEVLGGLPLADLSGTSAPVPAWEQVSRDAGVVRGEDWTVRLAAHAQALAAAGGERAAKGRRRAEDLAAVIAFLHGRVERAGRAATWSESAASLRDLLETLLPPENLGPPGDPATRAEQSAHATALAAVDELAVLDALGGRPDPGAVTEALTTALTARAPRLGRFGEGVHVGPLGSATGFAPEHVHVLGASEDLLPGGTSEDALLPDAVRAVTDGALPTVAERTARTEREFLAALQLAPHVTVSYARGDLRSATSRLPSRWLLPSLRALAEDATLAATDHLLVAAVDHERSFAATLATTDPAAATAWRLRALLAGQARGDPVLDRARRSLAARRGRRPTAFDGVIGPRAGLSPFEADRPLSATALETYASCPHAYFLRYVLGVGEIEDPDDIETISPLHRGSFLHECFDELVSGLESAGELPGTGEPWTQEHHRRLRGIAEVRARDYVARGLTGPARLWARTLADLQDQLGAMLDQDSTWRAAEGLAVLTSEARFGFDEDPLAPPVYVRVEGGVLRLRGAADLVDHAADGSLVVTDLKTGSSAGFQDIGEEDPVAGGTKLQLPTYARAVRARYGDEDTPVRARYWFPRGDGEEIDLPLTEAVDAQYRAALSTLAHGIAQGVFPRRPPTEDDRSWVQCIACNPDGAGYSTDRDRWAQLRETPEVRDLAALIDPEAAPASPTAAGDPR